MSDIRILETGQGGDLVIKNGDLEIDSGIFNNIYLGWFGGNIEANTSDEVEVGEIRKDWWGNSLIPNDESRQFNSDLERKLLNTALTSAGLAEIESVAKKDLNHMLAISEIEVNASLIAVDTLQLNVLCKEKKTGIVQEFSYIWDNLKKQPINPEDITTVIKDVGIKFFLSQENQTVEGVPFVQGELGVQSETDTDTYSINALGELIVDGPRANSYFSNATGEIFFQL